MTARAPHSCALVLAFVCAVSVHMQAVGAEGLSAQHFDRFHIVVASDTSEPEQIAVTRFIEHWKQVSGFEPTQSSEPIADRVNVWIGTAVQQAFPVT